MHKVLLDMSVLVEWKFCGIAQDGRQLFKALSKQPKIHVDPLVYAWGESNLRLKADKSTTLAQSLYRQSLFLDRFFGAPLFYRHSAPFVRLEKLYDKFRLWLNRGHHLQRIDTKYFEDCLWQTFLKDGMEVEDRALLKDCSFMFTDLALHSEINRRTYFNKSQPKLCTKGYDYVIFQESRSIEVSPETKKIIRYHDGIVLFNPQYFNAWAATAFFKHLRRAATDSYFIANSVFSANQALTVAPELEGRIGVVPCAVPSNNRPDPQHEAVRSILGNRLLPLHFREGFMGKMAELQYMLMQNKEPMDYVLAVATLEPRKNYVTMVRAWEKYRLRTGRDLKLVVVGKTEWCRESSMEALHPHVLQGNIFHVEKLPVQELRVLYSCAKALLFLTYAEGFGLSPVEALQYECPTIVSDIPALREVLGDAAIYCDPYSLESVSEKMEYMLDGDRYADIKRDIIKKGREKLKLYTTECTGDLWNKTLDDIKAGKTLAF